MSSTTRTTPQRLHAVGRRELLTAWLLLALLGALAFGPHVKEGGFLLDDWPNANGSLQSGGFGNAIEYFADLTLYRPVLVLYVPVTYEVFGTHMGLHLAWAGAIAIAVSFLLFAVLRTLGLPRVHAGLIAALVLLFPWADSTRMWATASQVTLGVSLALAGIWIALTALRLRSWRLHAVAMLLYALSILTYEIALPLIAAAGLLYVGTVGWRAAWKRWAVDLVLAFSGAAWVLSQTARKSSGIGDTLDHLWDIVVQGGGILGRTVIPLGPGHTTLALVGLAVLGLIGLAVWRRDRDRAAPGTTMTPWLVLGGAGLLVAALGWAMFVPADPYYTPSVFGITNRVNGLAAIGLVLTVYAGLGIVGALGGRLGDRPARTATAVTVALAVALGVSYKAVVERHSDIWTQAYETEMAGAGKLKAAFPKLPDGTTLFTSGYPLNETLGVPIFSTTWDVDGLVKMQYKNPTLHALPMFPGSRLTCSRTGAALEGPGFTSGVAPYGRVRFLDVSAGRSASPRNRRECRRVAGSFGPGPLYLDYEY
jgi:hypothetical protein